MGDACVSPVGHVIGHCVVRELDEVEVPSLGPVFADVSVIQLHNGIDVDNSLQIGQQTRRYNELALTVLHRVSKKLCKIVFVRTSSNVHKF